jgi:hypothetical protein
MQDLCFLRTFHWAARKAKMFLAQEGLHHAQSLQPAIVILAIALVLFWQVALRVLAIVTLILLVSGAVTLVQQVSDVIK